MSATLRRGACPTLAAPMATGDGLLARLNPVSGGVPPATLAAIAKAAARFGNGMLEVTARGSLQIRGLTPTTAPLLAEAVDRLDISVRSGVPVETGPLAGLDPREIADPTRLARQIQDRIAKAGPSARLGPKVSVVVDGGGRLNLGGVLADVRLEAVRVDREVRWRVAIGGTGETSRLLGVVEAGTACAVAMAVLKAVAAKGRTARARGLTAGECAGIAGLPNAQTLRSASPASVLPDISSAGGEMGGRDASALPSPLWGGWPEGSGGGGADALRPIQAEHASPPPPDPSGHPPHKGEGRAPAITTLPLSDGRTALGIGLPFGQATAGQIIGFANAAAQQGADEIRFAPGRALLAICRTATAADALKSAAAALGFVTDPADPRLAVVACAGAPACASGHLPARVIAAEIAAEAAAVLGDCELLHVSGCAKQCARPARAAFTLVGTATGVEIHLGDGTEGEPFARVANEDATAAFRRAAKLHRKQKKIGEDAAGQRPGPAPAA